MAAGKLKNLVILILLLANGFLLALVIPAQLAERDRRETADRELTELFSAAGVTLPAGAAVEAATLYPQEASCRPSENLAAVTAVLGQQVVASESAYRTEYRSAAGEATLTADGVLSATLRDRAVPDDPEVEVRAVLRDAGGDWSAPIRTDEGDTTRFFVSQQLDGVRVLSHELCFTYRGGALTAVDGRVVAPGTARVTRRTPCCASRDALIAFLSSRLALGWVGGSVESVEQGYLLAESATPSAVQLLPVWQIVTDAGTFRVDGVTRAVTAVDGQ